MERDLEKKRKKILVILLAPYNFFGTISFLVDKTPIQ